MNWLTALALGACGGAVVELVNLWGILLAWQKARHDALSGEDRLPPRLAAYIDPAADGLVALTRLFLGAIAGVAFQGQVTGIMAAIAVGASAPALLGQLGTARNLGEAIRIEESGGPSADQGSRSADEAVRGSISPKYSSAAREPEVTE